MTVKTYHAMTDDELYGTDNRRLISYEDLLAHYRELRDHHVAKTATLTKRDRSAILRMAGNIAGGIMTNPICSGWQSIGVPLGTEVSLDDVARRAVEIARSIVTATDAGEP